MSTPTRVAPTGGQQADGLHPGDQLGAQLLGALFGNVFDWLAWLSGGTPDGDFTIAGNLTVGGQPLAFTDFTFTADHTTSLFTRTAHGLSTGDGPIRLATTSALPGGLVSGVDYYVIKVDANTFKIAASRDCALEGFQIDFLDNGTGTQTLQHQAGTTRVTDTTCSRALTVGGASTLHDTTIGGEVFTFPSTAFVANSTTDTLAIDNHPFRTGDGPLRVTNSGGALPSPLLAGTDYYAIRSNSGKFSLATSRANALSNVVIDLTTSGTGTNSIASGTGAAHTNSVVVHGGVTIDGPTTVGGVVTASVGISTTTVAATAITASGLISANAGVAIPTGQSLTFSGTADILHPTRSIGLGAAAFQPVAAASGAVFESFTVPSPSRVFAGTWKFGGNGELFAALSWLRPGDIVDSITAYVATNAGSTQPVTVQLHVDNANTSTVLRATGTSTGISVNIDSSSVSGIGYFVQSGDAVQMRVLCNDGAGVMHLTSVVVGWHR